MRLLSRQVALLAISLTTLGAKTACHEQKVIYRYELASCPTDGFTLPSTMRDSVREFTGTRSTYICPGYTNYQAPKTSRAGLPMSLAAGVHRGASCTLDVGYAGISTSGKPSEADDRRFEELMRPDVELLARLIAQRTGLPVRLQEPKVLRFDDPGERKPWCALATVDSGVPCHGDSLAESRGSAPSTSPPRR